MQKAILACSLVMGASGATMPKMDGSMKKARASMSAKRKSLMAATASLSVADKKARSIQSLEKLEKEGIIFDYGKWANPPKKFFEIRMGMDNDCNGNIGRVEGGEVGRCMDLLGKDETLPTGKAYGMSQVLVQPNNGGFPIILFFDGHGCEEENFVDSERIYKTDFGFPPHYQAGNCMPFIGDDGVTPMFFASATWNEERFVPNFDAVMHGFDGREKGCQRGRYNYYEMLRAGTCSQDGDDEEGPVQFAKYDVGACNSDGMVIKEVYNDPDCAGPTVSADDLFEEECLFNFEMFFEDLEFYGDAPIEYGSKMCFQVPDVLV